MAEPHNERRLAAVLAADVVGYSRMMGGRRGRHPRPPQRSSSRIARADDCRASRPYRQAHGRRHAGGVRQRRRCRPLRDRRFSEGMAKRNEGVPPDRRSSFASGSTSATSSSKSDDIFGDGVNIAARLEGDRASPAASRFRRTPGGRCRARSRPNFVDTGEQSLKNIARPVRVYRLDSAPEGHVRVRKPPRPMPRRLTSLPSPFSPSTI